MAFNEKSILGTNSRGQHRIVYNDWGLADGRPIICIHGLTGNGHDFDFIAPALVADGYRPICIDLAGRGRSDFLDDPMDYSYTQYIQDIEAVAAAEGLSRYDWLGVSLGGLLGIQIAGRADSPIERLMLNDIGPEVPQAALDFIHMVIKPEYVFDDIPALEVRMRETRGLTWGPVTDEQWRHMAEHNARALEDGRITYAYDPRIAVVFEGEPIGDADLWACWGAIDCPTLVMQGKKSMLLTKKILKVMQKRIKDGGPDFDLVVFKGCGHVPSLMADNQIDAVREWLEKV